MKYDQNNGGALKDTAEVVSASDAVFTIDGIAVTRSSNTITDLFSGIALNWIMYQLAIWALTRSLVHAILETDASRHA